MWKVIGNTKTLLGHAALSVGLAYLLSNKVVESGIIKTSYEITFVLLAFLVFVVSLFALTAINSLPFIGKRSQDVSGETNEQEMEVFKDSQNDYSQKAEGEKNKQKIIEK